MAAAKPYLVAVFGVPQFEQEILERIFSISASRAHSYALAQGNGASPPDIIMVDGQNQGAMAEAQAFLANNGNVPQLIITRSTANEVRYAVRRPFTATRLLRVLDEMVANHILGTGTGTGTNTGTNIPARGTDDQSTPAPTPQAVAPRSGGGNGAVRALVVDDSLPVRRQVAQALEKSGIEADLADNGQSALDLLKANPYDIVFLDVVMPGLDGYEVCKQIKRDKNKKNIPVVMLTGKSSPFDKVKGRLSGCDSYLTKPVSMQEFTRTLTKCLNHSIAFKPTIG
jgi:two-component system cell cycle response regulator